MHIIIINLHNSKTLWFSVLQFRQQVRIDLHFRIFRRSAAKIQGGGVESAPPPPPWDRQKSPALLGLTYIPHHCKLTCLPRQTPHTPLAWVWAPSQPAREASVLGWRSGCQDFHEALRTGRPSGHRRGWPLPSGQCNDPARNDNKTKENHELVEFNTEMLQNWGLILKMKMMIHNISSVLFICNIYIQRHLAPKIVILITYFLEKVCFNPSFRFPNSQGHLYSKEWQVGSSRCAEQLTRKHRHHMSSGMYLGYGDSVQMCASLNSLYWIAPNVVLYNLFQNHYKIRMLWQ